MVELEDEEFASSHKYIKNIPTNGTTVTEHLLKINGKPQTPKGTRKIPTQSGRMKERKKKEKTGRDQHLWKGAEGERFSYSEKSICCGKISKGRKGPSEDQRGTQQPMCERQENVRTVHTWSGL